MAERTEEQSALRAAVRSFLAQHGTSAQVRQAIAEGIAFDDDTWKRLAGELGVTGLAVPEQSGGAGASLREVAIVVAELGRMLLPSPYLSSATASVVLAAAGDSEALAGLADGTTIAALASDGSMRVAGGRLRGAASFVMDAEAADIFLVNADEALYVVQARDAEVTPIPTLDATRSIARVSFDVPATSPLRADRPLGPFAADIMYALLAVECVGAAERALEITVDYLKTREQFGRPIGSFQAVKHRCADLAVALAAARALADAAVDAVDRAEFAVLAPAAKLRCAQAFLRVAAEMIQLHGGIGFTWEHDAHLYFKRAKANEQLWGPPSELRRLVGARSGLLR